MKLIRLTLSPFAGILNDVIDFEDGLNVVCGPNEAGKSTIVRALLMTLFTPTSLPPAALRDAIEDYLPLPNGDTIHTALEFEVQNLTFKIEKWWGGTKATKLTFPDNTSLTDPSLAQQKIREIVELNEATIKNILITNQSELKQCINTLKTEQAVKSSLSDLLRNSLMQQDGVNADDLRLAVLSKVEEYHNNWDFIYDGPKNRGGILKKHKKEIGLILQAYYAKEEVKETLRNATEYEQKLDDLTGRIRLVSNEIYELSTFLIKYKKPFEDAKQRAILDNTLATINNLYSDLSNALLSWPQLEAEKERIAILLPAVNREVLDLTKEQDIALQHKSEEVKKAKFLSAKKLYEELDELRKNLLGLKEVNDDHVKQAQQFEKEISDCTLSIELQKLKVNFTAKEPVNFLLKHSIDCDETFLLNRNEQKDFVVNGKFRVEAGPIIITTESGNANIPALEKELSTAKSALQMHLINFNVESVSELISRRDDYKKQKMQIGSKENTFSSLLQGQTYASLKEEFDRLQQLPSTRPIDVVQAKLIDASTKERELRAKLDTIENDLRLFVEKHTSKEELQKRLLRGLMKKEEVEEQLSQLEVFPEEFGSYTELSSEYENKYNLSERLKEELYDLKNKRVSLDLTKPDKSVKELSEELELLEENFLKKKEEGLAYNSVLNALDNILSTIDEQTYKPLEEKVNKYIARLTESRYSKVLLDGVQPHSLQNHSKTLKLKQLSKGTLDSVALALRLGSAEFYLNSSDGFLIMDDPLVDLDPKRQKAAAEVLTGFATTKQTIIFTCNDDTAKLLKKEYKSIQQIA